MFSLRQTAAAFRRNISPWKPLPLFRHHGHSRFFHTSRPRPSPIIPLPAALAAMLKTGKLVSFVSLSSKTSLTLLPHTWYRDRGRLFVKLLASVPVIGFSLLVVVGLDQAPNTSRLRLIYLTEEEEQQVVEEEVSQLLRAQSGLIAPPDNEYVQWLQTIADNLAKAAVDDVRDPVRPMLNEDEEKKRFGVHIICDSSTLNAMCSGEYIIVYDMMIQYMDFDTTKMAVILSHEIAHAIQRHFVETHGLASLLFMLGDITRGVFWIATESLGPYINQKINEVISGFITLETSTVYNRILEKEADLVGLKILAKAGYDPRVALEVWSKMAELDQKIAQSNDMTDEMVTAANEENSQSVRIPRPQTSKNDGDLEWNVRKLLDQLLETWFGSSHPPSAERIEYMREHMDEAVALYEEALRINGPPKEYVFREGPLARQEQVNLEEEVEVQVVEPWYMLWLSWIWPKKDILT